MVVDPANDEEKQRERQDQMRGAVVPRTAADSRPRTDARAVSGTEILAAVERRVLWLAARIVDAANHDRPGDEVKVGGHQASSASVVSIMSALYLAHLDPADRVAVKPHASPVFHALQYLMGNLDASYLTSLRSRGGLQAYPSRTKDPDTVDFSTGSVGLGAVSPLFAALTRRYVDAHFGQRPSSRFVAIVGDAELDEGNVWEAVTESAIAGLGNVLWVVDLNRQSLDRVVPGVRAQQWQSLFASAGWHVAELKYGSRLTAAFQGEGGAALREWIDLMSNEQYQACFGVPGNEVRKRFLDGAPEEVEALVSRVSDDELVPLVQDLGGHDVGSLLEVFAECDAVSDRPSVVFAYTVKGHGLPIAGDPRNHAALLSKDQIAALRTASGLTPDNEWSRFDDESPEGQLCRQRGQLLSRTRPEGRLTVAVPEQVDGRRSKRPVSTQEMFGRLLAGLSRNDELAPFLVTASPDVATSTNLAGVINRTGVFAPAVLRDWSEEGSPLAWQQHPKGQHIELGISEMNLFTVLGQLGSSWDLSDQPLIPVGTVYDPFVCRGLDALIHAVYSGARFIVAGTPSGVSLAPEGGAHQSTVTASIGLETPGIVAHEPAYATALDWLLCDAIQSICNAEGGATYFRLTTRALDQRPFSRVRDRIGDAALRKQVVAGGYRLVDGFHPPQARVAADAPVVHLAASGAMLPEALAAAEELADEGVAAHVIDITSNDRLYRAWRDGIRWGVGGARVPTLPAILQDLFVPGAPVVTIHDASPHAMAWLGSALGVPCIPLGVDDFGESGSLADVYALHDIEAGSVVNAALVALEASEARPGPR